jgi:hypothetical protein
VSIGCLKFLAESFGIRQTVAGEIRIKNEHGEFNFNNLALPLLLNNRNIDILQYIVA